MSDTDDTDVLLLIPPDFFNVVPSDSEDSFLYHGDRSEVERIVVNDLIDQVNELESRICFIESKENINFQPYLPGERKTQEGQKKKGTYSMDVKKEKLPPSTNVDPIVTQQRDTSEGSTAIGSSGTHCKQDLKTSSLDEGYLTAVGPGQGSGTLLSLSELWGEQELAPVFFQDRGDHANLASRLEEERYRRQHCEHLIVDLQGQLLQEHQKLAVAVKVDTAKDHAIARLQSAWAQLVQHWRELEEQRNNLANTLHLEREQYQQDLTNASKVGVT
uniref:Uncharacterized protein n=1 Tax=Timema genevievae TaxID=629358 RepID=A0A7R9PQZ3_TIMGE|nr:unnamed protein product [Timema genevievae]